MVTSYGQVRHRNRRILRYFNQRPAAATEISEALDIPLVSECAGGCESSDASDPSSPSTGAYTSPDAAARWPGTPISGAQAESTSEARLKAAPKLLAAERGSLRSVIAIAGAAAS